MKSNGKLKQRFTFSDPERVEQIFSQYSDKKSATLPLLHLAQSQEGYISNSVIENIADLVGVERQLMQASAIL